MRYELNRVPFKKTPKDECPGYAESLTCLQCIQRNPAKIACTKLGEYLDKELWNRCIGSGPFYVHDYRVRENLETDFTTHVEETDKFGRTIKARRVA